MKKFSSIVIMLNIILPGCEDNNHLIHEFVYNTSSGRCENQNGMTGFNPVNLNEIRESKNAECVDLYGHDLVYLLDTARIKNFNPNGYNILEGYNFRGSKFDGASIFFNNIFTADFSGADLRSIGYGYAVITGKIDQFTLLPLSGTCKVKNDSLQCAL